MKQISGERGAKIAVVGGLPSKEDLLTGIPFGSCLPLMRDVFAGAGVPFTSCLHANVAIAQHRNYCYREKGTGIIESPEYARDRERLKADLLEAQSEGLTLAIAIGDTALHALTGQWGVHLWRGSVLESSLVPGLKVVPILSPREIYNSYAPDDYVRRSIIRLDLSKAKRESESSTFNRPKYNFTIATNYLHALHWLDDNILNMQKPPIVAFDTEVIRGQVSCLSFAVSPTNAICIPFVDANGETMSADCEARVWESVAKILESEAIEVWMQNASFDMNVLFDRYGIVCRNVKDTMIAQGLIAPDFPKGLGFICSLYTDQPYYKDDHKDKEDLDSWSFIKDYPAFWRYNCIDSAVLLQARERMLADIKTLDLEATFDSHCNLLGPVLYMSQHGLKMDVPAMQREKEECSEKLDSLTAELEKVAGMKINPCSPQQVKGYFYITKGVKPYVKRTKGEDGSKETVDDDAIKRLIRQGFKEAELIQQYRETRKYRGNYLEVKLDDEGRMRSSYNPIGTTTGRLASSKTIFGFGTNLQNQPREMKKFMLIPEGYIGFAPDLAGAETTCVANIGNIGAMLEAMERGMDLHSVTAARLFKIPYESVSREPFSAGIQGSDVSQRDVGKRFNHSGNYGVGYKTIALRFGWPERDARELLEAYHSAYPEVRGSFQRQIMDSLRETRRVWNCMGRSRTFLGRIESLGEPAFAFPNQSTISDIINRRGLHHIFTDPLFEDVRLVNQIHDSIEFYVPITNGYTYAAEVLHSLRTSVEQPVHWKYREFTIGLSPVIMVGSHKNKAEFSWGENVSDTASIIQGLHQKLGGCP